MTNNGNDFSPLIHAVAFLEPLAGEPTSAHMEAMTASPPANIPTG
jgi:hypothetical protein